MGTMLVDTFKVLVREKGLFVWALAFPLILSTIFMFMFANLDKAAQFDPVPTAVVADANWEGSDFAQVVERLSTAGEDQLLEPRAYSTWQQAQEALLAGEVTGVLSVDEHGMPKVGLAPAVATDGGTGYDNIDRTILETVATAFVRDRDLIAAVARENPAALTDPEAIERAFDGGNVTKEASLTHSEPRETVRFYYALFGMAALFGAQISLFAVCQTQPNLSPVGARRALGAVGRGRTLAVALLASWLVGFGCLVVTFLYIRFVVGVDFGGREAASVVGLAAASLLACALGSALGALPKVDAQGKAGILTGIVCLLSLFAGLYGEPCMQLADAIARDWPLLAAINPAKVICDMLYSLYYYDGLAMFGQKIALLMALAAALFAIAAVFMRRQRYGSI